MRIAVVGAGPSGFFAAGYLLSEPGVTVDVFDRLPTPFGLVRSGVAPDHPKIKSVTRVFDKTASRPGFQFFGNVEIGRHVHSGELAEWYDAVAYAHGTDRGRYAGVPGEYLPGNHTAASVVGWYNGHPYHVGDGPNLTSARAVVIGNGNVALDIARIFTIQTDDLAGTDIVAPALERLRSSGVEEVVVLGRRGAENAAFTHPELMELGRLPGVDIAVDGTIDSATDAAPSIRDKLITLRELADRPRKPGNRRIVFAFGTTPVEILGSHRVDGIALAPTASTSKPLLTLPAGLVVHAVGYTGTPLPGVPFDAARGTVPHDRGRVVDRGRAVPGMYVTGWLKRGANGVIGTNRVCAKETVDSLLADAREGTLTIGPRPSPEHVRRAIRERATVIDFTGWSAIDRREVEHGERIGRSRVKLLHLTDLVTVGSSQ